MGSFSIWHWLILLIAVGYAVPSAMILRRIGYSGWWILVAVFIPLGSLIGLWVLATVRWPIADAKAGSISN